MFELHPQLASDTIHLGDWPLCRVLLMNDAQYPWTILVPRRAGLREIFELDPSDRQQLMLESCHLAEGLSQRFAADKINIGALGNKVAQLHIHHIARFTEDAAWPGPVWGALPAVPYRTDALKSRQTELLALLDSLPGR